VSAKEALHALHQGLSTIKHKVAFGREEQLGHVLPTDGLDGEPF